jgi:acyl carrier protein phosphodiesterase
MNWLAHLFLSEPTPEFRLGNLLPDLLPASSLQTLSPAFRRGMECHRRIDTFTDTHPIFRRSVARLVPPHRRFGGVLMDLFYDHFLAVNWQHYSPLPLDQFTRSVYADLESRGHELPPAIAARLQQMGRDDWLGSYREIANVRIALDRIGSRLRKPQALGVSVTELERNYAALQGDFTEFFPELRAHVENPSILIERTVADHG